MNEIMRAFSAAVGNELSAYSEAEIPCFLCTEGFESAGVRYERRRTKDAEIPLINMSKEFSVENNAQSTLDFLRFLWYTADIEKIKIKKI